MTAGDAAESSVVSEVFPARAADPAAAPADGRDQARAREGDDAAFARLVEPLEASLPLGLGHLDAAERKEHTAPFGPGDRILFYTDGISEARNKSGVFYPVEQCGVLLDPDPRTALDRLYDDVLRYTGGRLQDDSAALLAVRPAS